MAKQAENERREQAFLKVITYAEFAKHVPDSPYNVRYGGSCFWEMNDHPRKQEKRWHHTSDAAGAFMIDSTTYDEAVRRGVAHDFREASQAAIAISIIRHYGAMPYLWDGKVAGAFSLLNHRWPSLPGGRQQELTETEVEE